MIVFQEGETYIASCPKLDLSICGNPVPHAKEMLRTTIRLFLKEAEKPGTLDDTLSEVRCTVNPDGRYVPCKKRLVQMRYRAQDSIR